MDLHDAFARQRVDEPRLAARELPDLVEGGGLEDLPRRLGVLRVEGGDLRLGEVAQHQVLGDDVEGADLAERLAVGADLRLVVAHVQHADEGDRGGKRHHVAVHIAVAQLPKEGNQHRSGKAVGLVEEDDERLFETTAKGGQDLPDGDGFGGIRRVCLPDAWRHIGIGKELGKGVARGEKKEPPDGVCGTSRIRGVLESLQRTVQRDSFARGVDFAGERLDGRRLAGLARRMDDEIRLLPDEAPDLRHPVERGEHVVVGGEAGPRHVEIFVHGAFPCR